MKTPIQRVNDLASELSKLKPIDHDNTEKLNKKFRLEFNYNSNHLEGNTLTYSETELLLILDDTTGGHDFRELEEMKGHDVAYRLVEDWAKDEERPLSESNIKQLNQIILVRAFYKEAELPSGEKTRRIINIGNYKEFPNSVRLANGEMFHYASPAETPIKMGELIEWYRANDGKLQPIELATIFHHKFVLIHPFDDGNGRVARLVMNYVLLRNNLPPIVIKSADKSNYLKALNRADTGDMQFLINYMADQLIWSLELSIKAAKGESLEEQQDWMKKLQVLKSDLSRNKEIKAKKSAQVIADCVTNQLFPFIDRIQADFIKYFGDLFLNINLGFSSSSDPKNDYTSLDEGIEKFMRYRDKYSSHIEFSFSFKNFNRNGTNAFDLSLVFDVKFDEFNYVINTLEGDCKIEKYYDEGVNDVEYSDVINETGRAVTEAIAGKVSS